MRHAGVRAPRWQTFGKLSGIGSGRRHVEQHMVDVARLVEAHQALGEGFDLVF
jgi:hypothetical protein